MIHGRSKDKDIEIFLSCFAGMVQKIVCIRVEYEPFAEDPQKICAIAQKMGFNAEVAPSVNHAVQQIKEENRRLNGSKPLRIIICGSLYLAGDVLFANNLESKPI